MINQIESALSAIVGSATNLQHAAGAGRVFELYVMTGIGLALRKRGYDVWIRRSDGTRVHPTDSDRRFIQRGGRPTGLAPGAQGRNNATSIVFRRNNCPAWEMLNGIQFEGRSTAFHELDVAIVPESVAQALRNSPIGGYPQGRPRVSIECKDVGTDGNADEMRAFVARLYDLTILDAHHRHLVFTGPRKAIHPNAPAGSIHDPVVTYWNENRRTLNVLARRTGFRKGAVALTGYYAVEPHQEITVGSTSSNKLMDVVADWIYGKGY